MAAPNIVITEQMGSRQFSYDMGKITATRVFKVVDTANSNYSSGGLYTPSDVYALFGSVSTGKAFATGWEEHYLPAVGDTFPEESDIYAHSYRIEREAETDIWTVTFTYKNSQVNPAEPQPNEEGYVEWTLDVNAGFQDVFVIGMRYPQYGTVASTESGAEITSGTQIDIEGTPVSTMRLTTDINITETVTSVGGPPAIYANARVARGKRNNAAWYGIETGKALYIGCNVRRVGVNLYQVSHKIQEASDYHLLQYPERDATGRIPTTPKNGKNRATKVYWRQPFPDFVSFDAISSNW